LAAALVAAALGVMAAGFVAALPVLVRGLAFLAAPVQEGLLKGWYLVPPIGAGQWVGAALFVAVAATVLLGPRFWCRCLCPSGALLSAAAALRVAERRVTAACTACGQCVKACPFDAVRPDFTTRAADCTFCQTCGGVCPAGAIEFGGRFGRPRAAEVPAGAPAAAAAAGPVEPTLSRRGFLGGAVGGAAAAAGVIVTGTAAPPAVRPPGSVPEREFLRLCIRCGACFQACPNNVLQPMGLGQGLDGLWTPEVVASWSGCEPACNNCGHVCPTGAVRPLPIEEKRVARMGLAVVDRQTCLPHAGREACQMCVDECRAAGYDAIEFVRVGVQVDADGKPIEDTGLAAPVVLADKCVGCGLCQTRCHKINVAAKRLLAETAVRVVAGPGQEDRLMSGSYRALREAERRARDEARPKGGERGDTYLPDFLR
jgi:ferredoxin